MQSDTKTPDSIAWASGAGMQVASRPSGRQSPATIVSPPAMRKPATAPANPPSTGAVTASRATPGVDQATLIGSRFHRLSPIPASPIATAAAINPEAAWASLAPTLIRP